MPRKPIHETGTMGGLPLNIRLTNQQHDYLERLAEAERADMAAKLGGFAPPFTRADLIRQWIEHAARARGFAPPAPAPVVSAPGQGMLFPAAVVSAPVQVEPEAPAAVVSAPVQVEPETPAKRRRGKVEPDAVRAALLAALSAGGKQKAIADDAGIDASSMSKFKGDQRPLSEDKLRALAGVLRKLGHLR